MKKYIALIALLFAGVSSHAETITIDPPIQVGGQITAIEVGGIEYNANDNSWSISARPVVQYPQPQENESNGVAAYVFIDVSLHVTVFRPEIEAALGIANIDDATVKQLNDTVRAIALQKALAVLNEAVDDE